MFTLILFPSQMLKSFLQGLLKVEKYFLFLLHANLYSQEEKNNSIDRIGILSIVFGKGH